MSGAVVGQVVACVAVTAISGWLCRLGSGLRPVALAAWAAPLPLLVLAPRVPWSAAVSVAADARVPLAAATTVYSRLGDWFGWCCVALTTLIAVALI